MEVIPTNPDGDFEDELWQRVVAAVCARQEQTLLLREYRVVHVSPSVGLMTCLKTLDLAFNRIGFLPSSIGDLSCLQELYLDHNVLIELPESMGRLRNLELLHIQANLLTHVPELLCNLPKLRFVKCLLNLFDFKSECNVIESSTPSLLELCLGSVAKSPNALRSVPQEVLELHPSRKCLSCECLFFSAPIVIEKRRVIGDGQAQVVVRSTCCSPSCAANEGKTNREAFGARLQTLPAEEMARVSLSVHHMNSWVARMRNREPEAKKTILVIAPGSGFNKRPLRMEWLAQTYLVVMPAVPEPPAWGDDEGVEDAVAALTPALERADLVIAGSRGSRWLLECIKRGLIKRDCHSLLLFSPSVMQCIGPCADSGAKVTIVAGVCDRFVPHAVLLNRITPIIKLVALPQDGHDLESLDDKETLVAIVANSF